MLNKFENLEKYLFEIGKEGLALAFSGGIDSALLLYLCRKANILAVTFNSNFQTAQEIDFSKEFCKKYHIRQIILNFDIFSNPYLLNNPKDRCYHCKKMLFEKVIQTAKDNGKKYILDGTNFDDLSAYRPGRAALAELGVISPLAKFEITKKEIRLRAENLGIEIFNKPSTPCLATRFPYGATLTKEKLALVEKSEAILKEFGFESCRLRLYDNLARIEIPCGLFGEFLTKRDLILKELKSLDIKYITLDIEGLRSGSMD